MTQILDIQREICRTDGLTIDDSLKNFAKQNQGIMKKLILMECDDFQKPYVKKILREAERTVDENERQPDYGYCMKLSRTQSAIEGKSKGGPKNVNLSILQRIADDVCKLEEDMNARNDDRVVRSFAQNYKSNRIQPTKPVINLLDIAPDFDEDISTKKKLKPGARRSKDELQVLLKGIILGRIQNKQKFTEEYGINQLMHDIRDTQMAIEIELQTIREIKQQSKVSNEFSSKNVRITDYRIQEAQTKINRCKTIYAQLEALLNNPNRQFKRTFKAKPQSVKKMSTNLTKPPDVVAQWKKNEKQGVPRESNKDQMVFQ